MDEGAASEPIPTLHVLGSPHQVYPLQSASVMTEADADREEVIEQLSRAFGGAGDRLSAEFLLLALISSVTTRVPGGIPLGSMSLNLLVPKGPDADPEAFERIVETVSAVSPLVSSVELTIDLVSKGSFYPYSINEAGSTGLQSGLLQLAPSTVILMNEDTLEGGDLKDRAVNNLKALMGVINTQKLRYEFPFVGEDFGMDVDLGVIVVGQGKTFLPVSRTKTRFPRDFCLPQPALLDRHPRADLAWTGFGRSRLSGSEQAQGHQTLHFRSARCCKGIVNT